MTSVETQAVMELLDAANAGRRRSRSASDAEAQLDSLFWTGERLAVYGSLAPGRQNHHIVASVAMVAMLSACVVDWPEPQAAIVQQRDDWPRFLEKLPRVKPKDDFPYTRGSAPPGTEPGEWKSLGDTAYVRVSEYGEPPIVRRPVRLPGSLGPEALPARRAARSRG
jgi:hypothetical protein